MEAWINVYKTINGNIATGDVFYDEQEAEDNHDRPGMQYIKTSRIL